MPEELGTKDVLEQVDTRLGNVEKDICELRSEMNIRFEQVNRELRQEVGGLRAEMNGRFSEVNGRFDRLEGKLDSTTRWLVGLGLLSWLSLMVSIWLKS